MSSRIVVRIFSIIEVTDAFYSFDLLVSNNVSIVCVQLILSDRYGYENDVAHMIVNIMTEHVDERDQ
jgi:hypothetical protein